MDGRRGEIGPKKLLVLLLYFAQCRSMGNGKENWVNVSESIG